MGSEKYDDFHGGGGGGGGEGGEYGDPFTPDRFPTGHLDRFKREFGREPVTPPMGNRTAPGFRGAPTITAPGALGATTGTGPVMMVYGLDTKKLNCDKLFNLFCLYGNVARVSWN